MQASDEPAWMVAERYSISEQTVWKWRKRDGVHDHSHTAHRLQTTLTPAQEAVAVALRKALLLPLDDLLSVVREFLNPNVSRSGLDRCLRRHGVSKLRDLTPKAPKPAHKPFRAYEPGYLHVDVKYLPQMPDEQRRRYLFVAIDRATRWVFVRIYPAKTAANARRFLRDLERAAPMKITRVLTDNGKEFTDRLFGLRKRAATGNHEFDRLCADLGIEHRLAPPMRPQTNGMVERFNGRIEDVLQSHRFRSGEDLEQTILRYVRLYNGQLPQSVLKGRTPIDALKDWHRQKPRLFKKRPYNQAGSDSYVWTREGWLYLAVILDLHSRRVIGWAVSNRMKRDLAIRALNMAIAFRAPPKGCIHHTDRGSQYCSHDYQKLLRQHGFKVSMSGKGNCYDNAAVETFFKTIKAELIWRRSWETRRQAEVAIFEYINGFYNPRRRHSALGWKSPVAFERKVA